MIYLLLVLCLYTLGNQPVLCDEQTVLDFMLQGRYGPQLEGQLGPYLAGLIESDGTIYVPKDNYPAIKIYFHVDDRPLAKHLQSVLDYGTVHDVKDERTVVFSVNTLDNLIDLVKLTNGYYRSPKIDAFTQLVSYLNTKQPDLCLIVLPTDTSPLYSNAWLAGFVDGRSRSVLAILHSE